jgi:hypothetical protein
VSINVKVMAHVTITKVKRQLSASGEVEGTVSFVSELPDGGQKITGTLPLAVIGENVHVGQVWLLQMDSDLTTPVDLTGYESEK